MAAPARPRPILYYIRHGETDWNVEGRLQGQRDIPLNARGRGQGTRCGEILRALLGRDAETFDYVSSPLMCARETMERARAVLGLAAQDYRIEPGLTEISFGRWEGFTLAELRNRDPQRVATREHDKWRFVAPGGESYQQVAERMREWYLSLTQDTVATAHGGTARGLMAVLGIAKPAAAPLIDIEQGVVYMFQGETLTRYA
jgi:probable phosphoglycerate mutase